MSIDRTKLKSASNSDLINALSLGKSMNGDLDVGFNKDIDIKFDESCVDEINKHIKKLESRLDNMPSILGGMIVDRKDKEEIRKFSSLIRKYYIIYRLLRSISFDKKINLNYDKYDGDWIKNESND